MDQQVTSATSMATSAQRRFAMSFVVAFILITALLLPFATRPAPTFPAFVAIYQTTLILIFAVTSYILGVQYLR
jgi:hypothetical protein